ncbi:hypothetical protein [Leptospira stimsonii]|uniref:Uncharacterized protein n=1 Tax=Leptospira stimsonii TaxID=2202203 RepID=A0ABY2MW62_9LEPT|nr:hypothetical protein [Leptospira stimsonii]TGK23410.1 hypothetical protein EHO98_05210 [Leptospira stimsonii]TGM10086.1 hypothetical protein EHQ90_19300 [Leptospira stimsonii]
MKGSRILLNGKLIHRGDLWRRGRAMSERIGLITIESKLTLRDIAFLYSSKWSHLVNSPNYMGPFYREHLADVIKGTRNTARYVIAIEESWGLPIADIRRIYREDKEFERQGRSLSREEINTFANWYIQTSKTAKAVS